MNFKNIINTNASLFVTFLKLKKIYNSIKILRLKKFTEPQCKTYIAKMYKKRTGEVLDWDNLQLYTEKMQWSKLYDSTKKKSLCADKFLVREWVSKKIGEQYLIPVIGVWDNVNSIEFEKLPPKYVLKVNNGSNTNIIVDNNSNINLKTVMAQLEYWMKIDNSYLKGFELHYSRIKPRIIAEKFIESPKEDLPDYKFICFDGKVYYCWVDIGRYHHHKRNVYDLEWNLMPWNQHNYGNSKQNVPKPENFDEMVDIATKLCQGFSHVRVDLYNVNGRVYFGEMTFTNGSGYELIEPKEYNLMLGSLWHLF